MWEGLDRYLKTQEISGKQILESIDCGQKTMKMCEEHANLIGQRVNTEYFELTMKRMKTDQKKSLDCSADKLYETMKSLEERIVAMMDVQNSDQKKLALQ
jgi:phosphoribosyl-ATP pyrophosphohydrolase